MRNRTTQLAPVARSFRAFAMEAGKLNSKAAETDRAQHERHRTQADIKYRIRPTRTEQR